MKRILFLIFALLSVQHLSAQSPYPFIHVDQFGYLENAEKVAVLCNPIQGYNAAQSYTPGPVIEVREVNFGTAVLSLAPTPWNNGQTHAQSGDQGWWVDFSALTNSGYYYLYDPSTGERSATFQVSDNPYSQVLKTAGRMFFYNRCNAAKVTPFAGSDWVDPVPAFAHTFQDTDCRYVYDSTNATLAKDLSGGWFDAGDYNKYVTFTFNTLHNLLWAYEENPFAFHDNWDIPESGNGIPDLLDEIKWELDWLMRMNNSDGSTHIKMGSVNYSDNALAPPGLNTDPRYYGPTCTSASIAVASIFAHAARVYGGIASFTGYGLDLEARAEASWAYALPFLTNNNLETACDDGTIKAGDADWDAATQKENAVAAAAYLFALTGDSAYSDYVAAHYASTEPISNSWLGPYKPALNDALLLYATLPNGNSSVQSAILNSITATVTNNYNGFYGFVNDDLYRAHMPDWAYHWGSSIPKAGLGTLNLLMNNYNVVPAGAADRERRALGMLHYFHGVNPQGMVQLSNMGPFGAAHSANQIYHTWFADGSAWDDASTGPGPAPGYVVGGANASYSVSTLSPPYGQPPQKSYLDFNDDWPLQSWEITEPAIYYQAAYLRLLAQYVPTGLVSTDPAEPQSPKAFAYPNPGSGQLRVAGLLPPATVELLDLQGRLLRSVATEQEQIQWDTRDLPAGLYLIRVSGENQKASLRWIKR